MMLFGEKYPDPARMVSMGDFSRELCAGTHADNTGDVGDFDIIAEEAVSAGVRRITALTGAKARENLQKTEATLAEVAEKLNCPVTAVPTAVKNLAKVRELKKLVTSGGNPGPDAALPTVSGSGKFTAVEAKSCSATLPAG